MKNYQDNLSLSMIICAEVRRKVVCLNDIIPHHVLPFFRPMDRHHYDIKFGKKRVDLYLKYLQLGREIRPLIHTEAHHKNMVAPMASAAIAISKFGIAECQEFAALTYLELKKQARSDYAHVVFSSSLLQGQSGNTYKHAVILIGSKLPMARGSINQLDSLPDDVVIIDPLINHVGHANTYRHDQSSYLLPYDYDNVLAVDTPPAIPAPIDMNLINSNVNTLVTFAQHHGFHPFDKNILDATFENNRCHETALLGLLNTHSGLSFFGTYDEDYHVDACTEITTKKQEKLARSLCAKFNTGFFCHGSSARFFVLPNINTPDTIQAGEKPLREQIHQAYFS